MKKFVICIFSVLAVFGIGFRIWYVNVNAVQQKTELHEKSDWVDLDGSFQDVVAENTKGYSVHVNSIKQKTYKEFVEEYGQTVDYLKEHERPEHIVDLELTVKNDNSDGYINIFQSYLQSTTDIFTMNSSLWGLSEPEFGGEFTFSIPHNSEVTVHVPYDPNLMVEREKGNYMKDLDYKFVASQFPIKKMIVLGKID